MQDYRDGKFSKLTLTDGFFKNEMVKIENSIVPVAKRFSDAELDALMKSLIKVGRSALTENQKSRGFPDKPADSRFYFAGKGFFWLVHLAKSLVRSENPALSSSHPNRWT